MTDNAPKLNVGNILVASSALNTNEILQEGQLLIPILLRVAAEKGDSEQSLCYQLQVTVGFLHQLDKGIREGKSVSDEFLRACGKYLEVPSLLLQMVVGKITVADAEALDAFTGSTLCNAFETARRYATQTGA